MLNIFIGVYVSLSNNDDQLNETWLESADWKNTKQQLVNNSTMVAASRAWSLVARGRASLLALAPRFSSSAFLPIGIDFASCSTNNGNCKLPSFIPVPGGWAAGAGFTVSEKWLLFIRWKNFVRVDMQSTFWRLELKVKVLQILQLAHSHDYFLLYFLKVDK